MVDQTLVIDFVNTRDVLDAEEHLATPGALVGWLFGRGLVAPTARASAADLRHARDLREALRTLMLAHNDVDTDVAAATAVLDRVARRARLEPRFETGTLEPRAGGVAGALGAILVPVHAAIADGSWERVKACRARDCMWAFVDTAKNRSRAWCSMRVCGNREKVRSYRERHRSH